MRLNPTCIAISINCPESNQLDDFWKLWPPERHSPCFLWLHELWILSNWIPRALGKNDGYLQPSKLHVFLNLFVFQFKTGFSAMLAYPDMPCRVFLHFTMVNLPKLSSNVGKGNSIMDGMGYIAGAPSFHPNKSPLFCTKS